MFVPKHTPNNQKNYFAKKCTIMYSRVDHELKKKKKRLYSPIIYYLLYHSPINIDIEIDYFKGSTNKWIFWKISLKMSDTNESMVYILKHTL